MTPPRKSGRPPWPWLTPVLLAVIAALAGLGLISLRQDRRAAEQDAEILAKALADSLARDCGIAVAEAVQRFADELEASQNALLRFAYGMSATVAATNLPANRQLPAATLNGLPRARCFVRDPTRFALPAISEVPETPDWVLTTPREWLEKLAFAERAARDGNISAARTQLQAVAQSDFDQLRGTAELQLARLDDGEAGDQAARWRSVASRFPEATTASGLPAADIALLHAIAVAPSATQLAEMIQEVISRATFHPSFLTERLFTGLEQRVQTDSAALAERVSAARTVWNLEQNASRVLQVWQQQEGGRTGVFWTKTDQGRYFSFSHTSSYIETNVTISPVSTTTNVFQGTDFIITIVPDSVVDASLRRVASDLGPRWPRYLSAEFAIAGQRFGPTPWALGTTHRWDARPVLATRSDLLSTSQVLDQYPFKITVWLADPDLLYARQRGRLLVFGALIVAAAGIALAGAWRLQRNLNEQCRLNEQKSNFVSSVSHELRAPIASVRLMAESLERGKISEPAKQGEYFRFIGQECRRLSALIENVLDFSRIEQGRKQYELEPTDLVALVRETVKLMEPYAAEKSVKLALGTSNLEPRTSNLELDVDGRAIQQALVNLMDNAIKHSPKGEKVTVEILDATRNPQPAASIHHQPSTISLSVSDHGPGIPAEEHEKIFERFYRLSSELRRETQGVGIGLSIVKHIVEAHGGRVRLESEVGKGSRFTIELPVETELKPQMNADERR